MPDIMPGASTDIRAGLRAYFDKEGVHLVALTAPGMSGKLNAYIVTPLTWNEPDIDIHPVEDAEWVEIPNARREARVTGMGMTADAQQIEYLVEQRSDGPDSIQPLGVVVFSDGASGEYETMHIGRDIGGDGIIRDTFLASRIRNGGKTHTVSAYAATSPDTQDWVKLCETVVP